MSYKIDSIYSKPKYHKNNYLNVKLRKKLGSYQVQISHRYFYEKCIYICID